MYTILFYEDKDGKSELNDQLDELLSKSETDKNARIQYKQISLYIELLAERGKNNPTNITKQLDRNIWELRPGRNRVLYFYYMNNTYVLLHMFMKKTKKTPKSEIEKANRERIDFIARNGGTEK